MDAKFGREDKNWWETLVALVKMLMVILMMIFGQTGEVRFLYMRPIMSNKKRKKAQQQGSPSQVLS